MARQLASYAYGAAITDAQTCSVDSLVQRFERSGGDLVALIADVSAWDGLRLRSGEEP
jgi:hypothetical protein